jgi:peptide deformylase
MALRKIFQFPDPFLRQPTQPVTLIGESLEALIADMADTMYAEPGVGLAANQIGVDQSVIVFDVTPHDQPPNLRVLINPVIVSSSGSMVSENEGCLSVPDLRADVKRFAQVQVTGLDRGGQTVEIHAEGLLSVVLQHEIDHLNGVLFLDRISALKRQLYQRRIQKKLKNQ